MTSVGVRRRARHLPPREAMLDILREEGVDRVFGNPGTTELPFVAALLETPDIEYVLAVHEGAAVAMAGGYARATGRPAFVSLHVAAGLANGLVGLLNASRSRIPLVVTAGQQDRRHLVEDPMLSGDLVGLAHAAVKATFDVQHGYDLPVLVRRAFALAARPPAGPVFLSVPMDLLAEPRAVAVPARSAVGPPGAAPGVEACAATLARARAPVVVAGDGVGRAGATAELVEVAEAVAATVYHQPMHDHLDFPFHHPLHAGRLEPVNASIRQRLSGHDVLLVVGCHAFTPHHYSAGPAVPAEVVAMQLDDDPAELGRTFPVDLGLQGAIRPTLAVLARSLRAEVAAADLGGVLAERRAAAAGRRQADRVALDARARAAYGPAPLHPLAAGHAVASGLPDDAVLVEEAITSGQVLRDVLGLDRPGSLVHTVGGGLGWGIGAAIGTRLGDPSRPVVAVLGDGCTLFGLQGLWSAARYQVPVTFVVMNNGEYRTLKETLDSWQVRPDRLGRYVGLDLAPPRLDFTVAATFFGVEAVRVTDADQLRDVVAKADGRDRPLLVDVPVAGHGTDGKESP